MLLIYCHCHIRLVCCLFMFVVVFAFNLLFMNSLSLSLSLARVWLCRLYFYLYPVQFYFLSSPSFERTCRCSLGSRSPIYLSFLMFVGALIINLRGRTEKKV